MNETSIQVEQEVEPVSGGKSEGWSLNKETGEANPPNRIDRPRRRLILSALVWSLLVLVSGLWDIWQSREQAIRLAETEAKTNLERDLALRLWGSRHGGIYVPVTEQTQPNPYLAHIPNRDISIPNGMVFTLMNPATMLRELKQEQGRLYGILARVTGEKYLNPENAPDPWEKRALRIVAGTLSDYAEQTVIDGKPYLRMMQPMIMEEGCVKCHAWTGIPVGKLRGATDVAIPLTPYFTLARQSGISVGATHGSIWLLGMVMIGFSSRQERRFLEEIFVREEALVESNRQLEHRVGERTVDLKVTAESLESRNRELTELNRKLEEAKNQLVQSEKMASIGQLAAGVAHEINNPVGYVQSNVGSLERYLGDLLEVLDAYERAEGDAGPEVLSQINAVKRKVDLEFLKEDVVNLLKETNEGISRVKKIVQDLKDFSRAGGDEDWQMADLQQGIDSTLNVVRNEIKYKAEVVREYGNLPPVRCMPSQLNQVFMNLLVNAGQAIEEKGAISIRTGVAGDEVWVEVEDNGKGIAPENLKRIFDPFFTTKPIGQGTGLGLSVSYGIIEKHGGRIEVDSIVGRGTRFRVWLPIEREQSA